MTNSLAVRVTFMYNVLEMRYAFFGRALPYNGRENGHKVRMLHQIRALLNIWSFNVAT